MPTLRVDDTDIAELDADIAERLKDMVSQCGKGRSQKLSGFPQRKVFEQMNEPPPQRVEVAIQLEFDGEAVEPRELLINRRHGGSWAGARRGRMG